MTTTIRNQQSSARHVVAGLILFFLIAAMAYALGWGGSDSTASSSQAARIPAGSVDQVGAVAAAGSALPPYDATTAQDPAVGSLAPVITATYFDGTEVVVDSADGQARVMVFVAHWCPHCQAEVESLSTRFEVEGLPTGVQIVTVSTSVDAGAPNYPPSDWFLAENWPAPVIRDSSDMALAGAFGLTSFPFVVAVDDDGRVTHRASGSMTSPEWDALVASIAVT